MVCFECISKTKIVRCVYYKTQTCSIPDVLPLVEFVLEDGIRYDILGDLTLTLIVK